jgi:hypothetical protein
MPLAIAGIWTGRSKARRKLALTAHGLPDDIQFSQAARAVFLPAQALRQEKTISCSNAFWLMVGPMIGRSNSFWPTTATSWNV